MALNGWALLLIVSILLASVLHWRIKKFWVATALASIASPIVVVLIAAALQGEAGAFDGMVTLLGLTVSVPVSCLVGALFDPDR